MKALYANNILTIGKYGEAIIHASEIEDTALEQIQKLVDQPMAEGAHIRIMPDVHAGAGCVIGYTAKVTDKVVPNLIGVDIGCAVIAVELLIDKVPDLEELDTWVRKHIPTGRNIHSYPRLDEKTYMAKQVRDICARTGQNYNYVASSLGTLGGGNHFIEMATDQEGRIWLLVHSGSRNFGLKIAKHYQNLAIQNNKGHKLNEIAELKKTYTGVELGKKIDEIPSMVHGLEYIVGEDAENYLNDATVACEYALLNRSLIAGDIVDHLCYGMGAGCIGEVVNSVHNYTDAEQGIIRKGAIDASLNRWVVIPFNMRDGSIIGIGKGNEEWNYSAPHGAGRTMSRSQARAELSLEAFEEGMQGVYSTSVGASTIDEAPDAYKPFSDIIKYLEPTVEIKYTLKPVWNFKDVQGA